MRARTVKKRKRRSRHEPLRCFFVRLKSAWMVLRGKAPAGFSALPYETVNVRQTYRKPVHMQAQWWVSPAENGKNIELAKSMILKELSKAASDFVEYKIEPAPGDYGTRVIGDLWILEGEHHGEAENKS